MAEQNYLIVANGRWPNEEIWRPLANAANHIVACDGAALQCLENQVQLQTVIGDMDSLSKKIQTQILADSKVEFLRKEGQDENDLVKALRWVIENGASSIDIFGIEGGDLAHQFAAILALCEVPSNARIHTSKGTIELLPQDGYRNCSIEKNTVFSLFSVGMVNNIEVSGAKWNLKNTTLRAGTKGLHNQTEDKCLEIHFTSGQLLLFLDR